MQQTGREVFQTISDFVRIMLQMIGAAGYCEYLKGCPAWLGLKRSAESETGRENLMKKTFCTAIVLAAGSGKDGDKDCKAVSRNRRKPLLYYYASLLFERSPRIDKIILTVGSEEQISILSGDYSASLWLSEGCFGYHRWKKKRHDSV